MTLCIIPARSGSKRLANKNILPYKGKPLLHHTVKTALSSDLFTKIIVSSDDEWYLDIAVNAGAFPHKRNPEYATDSSTVVDVCLDVLDQNDCEYFCCLYATAVLVSESTLRDAHAKFNFDTRDMGAEVLMGVSRFNYHPVQAMELLSTGYAKPLFQNYYEKQSQFYPNVCVSNGTFYWADSYKFKLNKTFYPEKLTVFELAEKEVCDINDDNDYRNLLKRQKLRNENWF